MIRLARLIIQKGDITLAHASTSEALGRKIRQDEATELGMPTWLLVHEAIQGARLEEALDLLEYCRIENERNTTWFLVRQAIEAGRTEEALDLLELCHAESKRCNNSLALMCDASVNLVASTSEEEIEKYWRQTFSPMAKDWIDSTPGIEETLWRAAEHQRTLFGNITVTEDPDRYVMKLDPCGSGGRLMRTRTYQMTKKAYPWSWSKSGISYFCTHCAILWQIIPIELRGYPIKIVLPPEKPEDPCFHLFYKKPESIPEEYFTMVGKTKRIK